MMPTPTYDLIEEKVLGSAQASVTFSSIPGTYKDLVLECIYGNSNNSGEDTYIRFNSDSGSNYSRTIIYGDGTTAASARNSNITEIRVSPNTGNSVVNTATLQIMSYANTNVNKTTLARSGNASGSTQANVSLWRSTAAITSIVLTISGSYNFVSGTTFRLWGVSG